MLQVGKIINVIVKRAPLVGALLAVTVVALLPFSALAQGGKKTGNSSNTPFTGVWDTVAGGARFSVQLKQIGKKVTGTYKPRNGKILDGVVTGNKVEFKWSQDGGAEGIGEFTLSDDRKSFTGSSTMIKPELQNNTWNTYVPAPPRSFAGTWDLVNNIGVRIPLTIVQQGASVTGIYPSQNGKLEGMADGRNLDFKWVSDKGSGSGHLNISNSGESFSINFKNDNGQEIMPLVWGERASGESSDNTRKGGSGGKITASYGGSWILDESGFSGGMDLAQTGAAVSGTYATGRGPYSLRDAKVNGSFLRFKLVPLQAGLNEKIGELRMDPDGRSFKGTVGGIAVTGTIRNP